MDGVKSWLSKSKGSTKNLSDDGSLKSSRSVERQLLLLSRQQVVSSLLRNLAAFGLSECNCLHDLTQRKYSRAEYLAEMMGAAFIYKYFQAATFLLSPTL